MKNLNTLYIGVGAGWPIQLSDAVDSDGKVIYDSDGNPLQTWKPQDGDPDLIKQNIEALCNTAIGFMIRNEQFGTRLSELIEEPNNQVTQFLVSKYITEAIRAYEPRVTLNKVKTIRSLNKLNISLYYKLSNINVSEQFLPIEYIL